MWRLKMKYYEERSAGKGCLGHWVWSLDAGGTRYHTILILKAGRMFVPTTWIGGLCQNLIDLMVRCIHSQIILICSSASVAL